MDYWDTVSAVVVGTTIVYATGFLLSLTLTFIGLVIKSAR